jgi:hypothetical protein
VIVTMDDSPPVAPRPRRRLLALLAAVVVLAAGVLTAALWPRHAAPRPVARASSTPVATPTPAVPSSTAPPAPPAVPAVRHDYVAAAAPKRFTLSGSGFTIKAQVCGMENVRPLDPPGEQHHTVCWVQHDFGVAPGSHSGTTYVLGHAWGQDTREVLNAASSRATRDILAVKPQQVSGVKIWPAKSLLGARMTLTTRTGTLTYAVRKSYGVRKADAASVKPMMDEKVRNRIVVITCAERNHVDYDYDVILEAYLVSSVRTSSNA